MIGRPLKSSEAGHGEITPLEGLPALSLDALTSVAYGPEAIVLVLGTAGVAALHLVLPITIGIVALLALLVISYRQVIDGYPHGGGAYAVSRANLGTGASQVAAASLVVDYTLTVAVSIAAGIAALTSAFPVLSGATVPLCLAELALLTVLNLRGLGETARAFLLPTFVFIVGLLAVIAIGIVHPLDPHLAPTGTSQTAKVNLAPIGVLLVLKAFSAGCSALTGVEAIANGVPLFRPPRQARAKQTELLLGVLLGVMLIGLAVLVDKFHVGPRTGQTVLSQVMAYSVGRGPGVLHRLVVHHRGAGTGRQHLLRRPARPGQPAVPGPLPPPRLRPAGGPAGVLQGDLGPGRGGRRPAGGGPGQHQLPHPPLRHRGVHRLHPGPDRDGAALAAATGPRTGGGRPR